MPRRSRKINHLGVNRENIQTYWYHLRVFLLFFSRLLSSISLSSESDFDSEELESESEESELWDSSSESDTGFCCCMISRGIFFKYSRKFSVRPPSPIEVKKLMENLVFFGLSLGNIDSNESCIVGSVRRSFNSRIPKCSDNSYTIKTKIQKLTSTKIVKNTTFLISMPNCKLYSYHHSFKETALVIDKK